MQTILECAVLVNAFRLILISSRNTSLLWTSYAINTLPLNAPRFEHFQIKTTLLFYLSKLKIHILMSIMMIMRQMLHNSILSNEYKTLI